MLFTVKRKKKHFIPYPSASPLYLKCFKTLLLPAVQNVQVCDRSKAEKDYQSGLQKCFKTLLQFLRLPYLKPFL